MKFDRRFLLSLTIIAVALFTVGVRPAAAGVAKCEVDIESDGSDADDVCVVTSANPDECTLKKVIGHAYADKWCAIDHNKKYGAFVFIQDPVDGEPSSWNKNTEPGKADLTQTIILPGPIPSDGSGNYNKGSGDPLVITGYLLQYTDDCLAKGCSNPSSNDWEDHLLDGTFWEPQNTNHDMFDIDKWGDKEKNGDDWDPVIELPEEGDRAEITVDLPSGEGAAFEAGVFTYVQFRHVTLRLKKGAAFDFSPSWLADVIDAVVETVSSEGGSILYPAVSFLHSRIEVEGSNPTDHIFKGEGRIHAEGSSGITNVMGHTTPAVISIGKAVSADAPFAIVELAHPWDGADIVRNLRNAIAFETPALPQGLSLATWPNAESISCRVTGERVGTEYVCRFDQADLEAIQRKVVFLEEYDDPDDLVGATISTVGDPQDVAADGTIHIIMGEAVFAADGRRIEIEMPTCPDGSVATPNLSCTIEHGAFTGFIDGVGGFDCDMGYKKDAAAGRCVLDCFDGTVLDDAGAACVVPAGHEWNVDQTEVYEECPGDPVPNVDGSDCICKDSSKEPVELESGNKCKPICADPLMFRNEQGNCDCPDGYKKKSNKCVQATASSPQARPPRRPATKTPAEDDGGSDTDGDLTNASTCIGFSCLDDDAGATSSGRDSGKARVAMGSGCSLAAGPSAAGGVLAILLIAGPILALIRRR